MYNWLEKDWKGFLNKMIDSWETRPQPTALLSLDVRTLHASVYTPDAV